MHLSGGVARLYGGTIVCSASNLFMCLKKAISFGIALENVIRAATYNPACYVVAENAVGSISDGKFAGFLVRDGNHNLREVRLGGNIIR